MKDKKITITTLISVIMLLLSIILIYKQYIKIIPVTLTTTIILLSYNIYLITTKETHQNTYIKKLNNILKIYESVIQKKKKIYNFKSNKILYISTMDDLIKAQKLLDKPINYIEKNNKTTFILEDDDYLLVYKLEV